MKRSALILLAYGLGTLAAATGETTERHFYAGVGLGSSSVDGRSQAPSSFNLSQGFPDTISLDGLPLDDDDTAWTAFVGYAATQYVGVELGFWNHGTLKSRRLALSEPVSLGIKEWYFGATLRYPLLSRLAVTGSAGISRAQFDVDGTLTVLVLGPRDPFDSGVPVRSPQGPLPLPGFIQNMRVETPEDETGGYWSVGLSWRFSDAVEAGLSFGRRDLHVQRVETLALSMLYAF